MTRSSSPPSFGGVSSSSPSQWKLPFSCSFPSPPPTPPIRTYVHGQSLLPPNGGRAPLSSLPKAARGSSSLSSGSLGGWRRRRPFLPPFRPRQGKPTRQRKGRGGDGVGAVHGQNGGGGKEDTPLLRRKRAVSERTEGRQRGGNGACIR